MRPCILLVAVKKVDTRQHSRCRFRVSSFRIANTMLFEIVIEQPDEGFDGNNAPIAAVRPGALKLTIADCASPISFDSINSFISTDPINHDATRSPDSKRLLAYHYDDRFLNGAELSRFLPHKHRAIGETRSGGPEWNVRLLEIILPAGVTALRARNCLTIRGVSAPASPHSSTGLNMQSKLMLRLRVRRR